MPSEQIARTSRGRGLTVPAQRPVPLLVAAVERAYAAHYRDVYRYVLALTRSESDAEDVTAEVFERALGAWRSEPERVEAWLLLVARRIATDRWRRARRLVAAMPWLRAPEGVGAGESGAEFWAWFDAVSRVLRSGSARPSCGDTSATSPTPTSL